MTRKAFLALLCAIPAAAVAAFRRKRTWITIYHTGSRVLETRLAMPAEAERFEREEARHARLGIKPIPPRYT